MRELIENDGVGERGGGVAFAEIEMDAPNIGDLAGRYIVSWIYTCLKLLPGTGEKAGGRELD